jgi:hypothetical protein
MNSSTSIFHSIVKDVYGLPIEEKQELYQLLERNIIEERRTEIYTNYKLTKKEEDEKKLIFSNDVKRLKKLL